MTAYAPIEETSLRRVAAIRHRLHQIPEIGYEEFKTAALIRAELDALGVAHVEWDDCNAVLNVNAPEDVIRAQALL